MLLLIAVGALVFHAPAMTRWKYKMEGVVINDPEERLARIEARLDALEAELGGGASE